LIYLAKCSPNTNKKVRKAIEEENQSTDDRNDVSDIDAKIEKLQEERNKLIQDNRSKLSNG